jgi:hypothetical protein
MWGPSERLWFNPKKRFANSAWCRWSPNGSARLWFLHIVPGYYMQEPGTSGYYGYWVLIYLIVVMRQNDSRT